jgi:sterol-4alpha-carboxylate 3-dehydrogenase (decarboxylating)
VPGFLQVLRNKQTNFQIGNNTNLFDWSYIDNIVHAHLLAAEKLGSTYPIADLEEPVGTLEHSVRRRELPTSVHRVNDDWWEGEKELSGVDRLTSDDLAGIDPSVSTKRNRFDQFFETLNADEPDATEIQIAGQVFFITNGEPIPFWDLARKIWYDYAGLEVLKPWKIPQALGLFLGIFGQLWSSLTGRPVGLNKARVQYACARRYFNIERSRRLLGYEPVVGLEEGIARTMRWFKEEEAAGRMHLPK